MLAPGLATDLRVAREVFGFTIDGHCRIITTDNLGRPEVVPETLTRWSVCRASARRMLDWCVDEYGWTWHLAWDGTHYTATLITEGCAYNYIASTEALAICGAALKASQRQRAARLEAA